MQGEIASMTCTSTDCATDATHTSGIQVSLTKISESNGMVTKIAICDKCT